MIRPSDNDTPADRARRECVEQGLDFEIVDPEDLTFVVEAVR